MMYACDKVSFSEKQGPCWPACLFCSYYLPLGSKIQRTTRSSNRVSLLLGRTLDSGKPVRVTRDGNTKKSSRVIPLSTRDPTYHCRPRAPITNRAPAMDTDTAMGLTGMATDIRGTGNTTISNDPAAPALDTSLSRDTRPDENQHDLDHRDRPVVGDRVRLSRDNEG
jgi:hypothetical protein